MAPEEFVKGSLIDLRTNVLTMGATAFVFLSGSTPPNDVNSKVVFEWLRFSCS